MQMCLIPASQMQVVQELELSLEKLEKASYHFRDQTTNQFRLKMTET